MSLIDRSDDKEFAVQWTRRTNGVATFYAVTANGTTTGIGEIEPVSKLPFVLVSPDKTKVGGKTEARFVFYDVEGVPLQYTGSFDTKGKKRKADSTRTEVKQPKHSPKASPSEAVCIPALTSDSVYSFLFEHMLDKTKVQSLPLLSADNLAFELSGRDLSCFTEQFSALGVLQQQRTNDRTKARLPVCSAISGMGKSRLLDEFRSHLPSYLPDFADWHFIGVVVPYWNGHAVGYYDEVFPVAASFGWRLLHRLFLEDNSEEEFTFSSVWKDGKLPADAAQLTIKMTMEVVMRFCGSELPVLLFLGVDEYQSLSIVERDKKQASLSPAKLPKSEKDDTYPPTKLRILCKLLVDQILNPLPALTILPLFCGTDLGAITNSSEYFTMRMPIRLLLPRELSRSIEGTVGTEHDCAEVLEYEMCVRRMYFDGGLPRPSLEYAKAAKKVIAETKGDEFTRLTRLEQIADFSTFGGWGTQFNDWTIIHTLIVVAHSLTGQPVARMGCPFPNCTTPRWSRLRDMGFCLLDDALGEEMGMGFVSVPYGLMRSLRDTHASSLPFTDWDITEERIRAARNLVTLISSFVEEIDECICKEFPWQLWERFGAYFHALRINALLFTGRQEIRFANLVRGTTCKGCSTWVRLQPVQVVTSAVPYSEDIATKIPLAIARNEEIDWVNGNAAGDHFVVLNSTNSEGIGIFFALKKSRAEGHLVCVDQRKRTSGSLGPTVTQDLLDRCDILPTFLAEDSTLVRGLCNVFPSYRCDSEQLPSNSFVLSHATFQAYHGFLAYHPAASPSININYDPVSYLKLIFSADTANSLVHRRMQQKFVDIVDLQKFVGEEALKEEFLDCITF